MAINRNPVYDDDYVTLGYLKEQIDESSKETRKAYSRNFGTQPTPPYYVNDTWTDDEGKLYVCIKERLIGKFDISDWTLIIDKKPYDDLVAEYGDITVDMLASQVYDHKLESFVQATDPSDEWETYIDREQHVYDFWRNTTDGKEYVYIRKDTNPITYEWELRAGSSIIWNTATGHKNMFNQKPETYDQYDLWYVDDSTSSEDIPDGININTWVMADKANTEYDKTDWSEAIIDIDLFITETKVYSKIEVDRRVNILENTFNTKLVKTENSIMGQVSSTYATQEVVTSLDSELGLMEDRMTTTEKNVNTLELTSDRTISSISSITNKVSGSATYDVTTDTTFEEGTDYYIIDEDHYVMLAPGVDYVVGSNIADYDGDVYNATFTGGLEDNLVSTNQKVSTLEQTSEGFEASIASLQSGLGTTNQKVTTLEATTDGITAQISNMNTKIDGVSADFEDFKDNEYIQSINNLQDQIDGAIQFWNGPEIPTINNYPANQWTTEADKNNHRADIYTVIEDIDGELKQGKGYRFDKVGNTWQWIELTDNELSAVQAIAQEALDKSNKNGEDITQLEKKDLEIEANIDGLDVRLTTLRNDYDYELTTSETITGNPITIEDAGAYPCESFIVEGKSEQETSTQGKNYFTGNKLSNGTNLGITYDFDNSVIKLNGTTTSGGIIYEGSTKIKVPAGTYNYSLGLKSGSFTRNDKDLAVYLMSSSTEYITGSYSTSGHTLASIENSSSNRPRRHFTTSEDIELYVKLYINGAGIVCENVELEVQLESGETMTDFEQFIPDSPSIDYPSEIKIVKGIENLLNVVSNSLWYGGSGGTFVSNNNGTSIIGQVNKTGKYTIHKKNIGNRFVLILSNEKPDVGVTYTKVVSESNHNLTQYTFEATEGQWVWLGLDYNSTQEEKEKSLEECMLEFGSVKHPYVPYGRYLINKINGKNLFDYITNFNSSASGITNTINSDGSITVSGIPDYNYVSIVPRYDITDRLIDGEEYTISQSANSNAVGIEVRAINKTSGATTYYQHNKTFKVDLNLYTYNIVLFTGTISSWGTEERTITGFYQLERGSIATEFEPYKEKVITYDLKKENLFDINSISFGSITNSNGVINTTGISNTSIENNTVSFVASSNYKGIISDYINVESLKDYIVKANSDYNSMFYIAYNYDVDKNYLGYSTGKTTQPYKFTTLENAKYVRVVLEVATYTENTIVNVSDIKIYEGSSTGDYHELASKNDIKDELDEATGILTKRIGKVVLDGSEDWKLSSTESMPYIYFSDAQVPTSNNDIPNMLCTHYKVMKRSGLTNGYVTLSTTKNLIFYDKVNANNLDTWKTYLSNNPVTVYYVLAEPETIQLQPTEIELFKGTNNIYTLDDLEPNMNITYLTDSKLNAQYATKSELKITEGRIESGINATLQEYSKTTEMRNIISQEVSESTNQILLEVENKIDEEVTGASILLKINEDTSSATINADKINLNGVVTANNTFKINIDGSMEATGGKIGGWSITTDDIYNSASGVSSNLGKYAFWAGETNGFNGAVGTDAKFKVGHGGDIEATAGRIGGWNITSGYLDYTFANGDRVMLANGSNEYKDVLVCYVGGQVPFYLHSDGYLHASNANITGTITSSSGTIGGFTLGNYSLSGATSRGSMRIQRGSSASVDLPANGGRLMLGSTNTNGVALTTASTLVISDTYDHVTTGHDLATIGIRALNGHVRIASNDTVNINAPTFIVNGSAGWTGYLDVRDADGSTKLRLNFKSGICTGYTRL